MSKRIKKPAPPKIAEARIPERYDAKTLVGVYRWCKANPGGRLTVRNWTRDEFTAESWLARFRVKLDEKITAKDPRRPVGRKASQEYEIELYRLRRLIGNRIAVYWIAPILGERVKAAMAERMRDRNDY